MPPSTFWHGLRERGSLFRRIDRRFLAKFLGLVLLLILICVEVGPLIGHAVFAQITALNHTEQSVDETCHQTTFSNDGNPFPLCPGPASSVVRGGNCVWWAWEQWHLLGYDLPRNWGNAADWVSDAEHAGLPLGRAPRVGSIAVFPIGDGVWAFTSVGHVAFVTGVSSDSSTFNVTYQNYGDPTPMHIGINYPVNVINEPHFQNGNLRFIYFPRIINLQSFARLPGVTSDDFIGAANANSQLGLFSGGGGFGTSVPGAPSSGANSQIALGLPTALSDQEFNADFAGIGLSDLLLYNRARGTLKVLSLSDELLRLKKLHLPRFVIDEILANQSDTPPPQLITLSDKITPANGWGSALDIHIGDFTGAGKSEILLYDRITGKLQLISLTPDLTIEKHVIFQGYGPGWELYVGTLDGQHSSVFMYNRLVNAPPIVGSTPTPAPTDNTTPSIDTTPTSGSGTTPTPGTTPTTGTTPTPTPTAGTTPTPTAGTTPTPTPTHTPTPTPTPKPDPTPTHTPTPTPKPDPTPTHTPTPTPKPDPTPKPSPTPTCGTAVPTPTEEPTDSPVSHRRPCPSPTPTHICPGFGPTPVWQNCASLTPVHIKGKAALLQPAVDLGQGILDNDLSNVLSGSVPQALASNVIVLDFDHNFNILHAQRYALMDNAWEIYVGSFVSANQDGLLLYDRMLGEIRLLGFDVNLQVVHNEPIHNVDANWEVFSGDFMGAGRSQALLYDPSSGNAQILILKTDLSFAAKQDFTGWGTNQALYVGHFGAPTLSVMLYDPQAIQSTFFAFDSSLTVVHQVTVSSWDNHWQILIGSFLDRSRCLASHNCSTGDDILVLDRQTGQMEQFVFSFGNVYQVDDTRSQAFVRSKVAVSDTLTSVDTTAFSLLTTLITSIRGEELY